jgi:hypothetical protein
VDAGITRLELRLLSDWGGHEAVAWASAPFETVRLPALRHLDLHPCSSFDWVPHGAAHMRAAARLVAAHAASLHTLILEFWITSQPESHRELAALEVGFLESVLLAAPLPALQRLHLDVEVGANDHEARAVADEERCLEALRPLARLSLPRLARLSLEARDATGQGVRWLEGAHLPVLRHLKVTDYGAFRPEHPCIAALAAPRWSALEALELSVSTSGDGMAALSAALAPTLRRLAITEWPFGTEGCAEEWPQLRSLHVWARVRPQNWDTPLAQHLGPVRINQSLQFVDAAPGAAGGVLGSFSARLCRPPRHHPFFACGGVAWLLLRKRWLPRGQLHPPRNCGGPGGAADLLVVLGTQPARSTRTCCSTRVLR